jgi:YHS domain-containing protein
MSLGFRWLGSGAISAAVLACACLSIAGCEENDARRSAAPPAEPPALAGKHAELARGAEPAGVCGVEQGTDANVAMPSCGSGCGCAPEGCGQAPAKPSGCGCGMHEQGSADKPVVPITEAKLGDRTRCPVTQQIFIVNASSPKLFYHGKTYWFCCEGCLDKFKQSPERFTDT